MADFTPTAEQNEAIRLFNEGNNLKIRAAAGSGKTATIVLLSKEVAQQGRKGRYISFNKSIAVEAAKKMPACIEPSTAHSLAYRYAKAKNPSMMANLGKRPETTTRGRTHPMHAGDAAKALGVTNPAQVTDELMLTPAGVIQQAIIAVNNFCKTDDPTIDIKHIGKLKGYDNVDLKTIAPHVLPAARRVWEDLTTATRPVARFGHQHYLKWWALQNPIIGRKGDVLFLDESQDTAPVLAGVVAKQTHLQTILVGDSAQSIYRFTGAISAMDTMGADFAETRLTQSWRFGPTIAALANTALEALGDDMRVIGNPGINDTTENVGDPDAVLCRTNATALQKAIDFLAQGRKVCLEIDVTGGKSFVRAADELQMRGRTNHPELSHFGSWDEVLIHASSDAADEDWITWVNLIKKVGTGGILAALDSVVPPSRADITVATAHKSKGREWNHVHLADDLAEFYVDAVARDSEWHIQDALMLIYVAITRAKKSLNPGQLVDIPKLTEAGLLLRAERQAKANEGAAAAA